jgi:hypothetical protein
MRSKRKTVAPARPPDDPFRCPPGVPQEIWNEEMRRQEDYISKLETGLIKHVQECDRKVAAKKTSANRTKPKRRG